MKLGKVGLAVTVTVVSVKVREVGARVVLRASVVTVTAVSGLPVSKKSVFLFTFNDSTKPTE